MRILLTGSQGFIGSYLCQELLSHGHEVVGIDDYSKYGRVVRPHDTHPNFLFYEWDLTKPIFVKGEKIPDEFLGFDVIIMGAAMIGGISYFHKYAYDLLATNERIMANTFDLAIELQQAGLLGKVVVISSSMVFENTDVYPTPENQVEVCKPPTSTYGFQKLATEYFCKGAWEQYGVPYNIVRPFNCVGVGEEDSIMEDEELIGNHKMMMSHVLPDLVSRALVLGKNDPLPILGTGNQVRHYTNGKDIARAIHLIAETEEINEDFNISTSRATTVRELATIVWEQIHGCQPIFQIHKPFEHDVQLRSPDVSKAKDVLGFETEIDLEESVAEVIEYMRKKNDG